MPKPNPRCTKLLAHGDGGAWKSRPSTFAAIMPKLYRARASRHMAAHALQYDPSRQAEPGYRCRGNGTAQAQAVYATGKLAKSHAAQTGPFRSARTQT